MYRFYRCVGQLLLVCIAACNASLCQASPDSGPARTVPVTATTDIHQSPALQDRYPRYRIQPSDTLAITFPLSSEINQTVTVQPDGFITLANVGSVRVQGETVPEIVDTLKKAYTKILHDPIVAVDVTNFQHPQFTVSGEVGKPGQYDLRADTTIMEGIAAAGGFTENAKSQVFYFHRVSPDWVEVKKLDLKQIMHGKNVNEDLHLQAGDMVYVPEKFISSFKKYVPYGTGIGINPSAALFK